MAVESITIPLQAISDPITEKYQIDLHILRTDLNHPNISGNKLFKLKYNLQEAVKKDKKTILTFGGAFSNHIAATAAAGKEFGFKTIGIIHGEEYAELNPTLKFAVDCGMELHYVSRTLYQNKKELYDHINQQFSTDNFFLIPEGGANESGIKGCKEMAQFIPIDFDLICAPCGTGTTLTGIILSLKEQQKAMGFQVLRAENYIQQEVTAWLKKTADTETNILTDRWTVNEDYHFGGYAKVRDELKTFIRDFEQTHHIPLDPIYTGKMMFGIYDLMKKGYFKKDQTIIAIHTGGLQGNTGFNFLSNRS